MIEDLNIENLNPIFIQPSEDDITKINLNPSINFNSNNIIQIIKYLKALKITNKNIFFNNKSRYEGILKVKGLSKLQIDLVLEENYE